MLDLSDVRERMHAMGFFPAPSTPDEYERIVRGQIESLSKVAAEAAVTGDYNLAILALTINPLVASDIIAKQIVDEMLEAHKKYLPQFFKN